MSGAPPPNWYPDPHDEGQLRWWDGTQWTEHRHSLVPAATQPAETADQSAATQQPAVDQWGAATQEPAVDQWGAATRPEPTVAEQTQVEPWQAPARTWTAPTPSASPMALGGPGAPPRTNRRPMIIGAAVIGVIAIAAIAFAVTRGGDDAGDVVVQTPVTSLASAATTSRAIATTTTATTASTATTTTTQSAVTTVATTAASALPGTTFTDPTNVYRLRVAPEWKDATTSGGRQTWSTGTGSSALSDFVSTLVEKLPSDISMEDYLAASVRNAPKTLPSFVEISRSVNTVNGKVLGQLDFTSKQDIALRHRLVILIKGRNAIVVTYTTEPARFDAESVKVQPYLTSVEGV